jgi:uncharacterized PurR-regulated membrane protein YhhQ (DUF165 family)
MGAKKITLKFSVIAQLEPSLDWMNDTEARVAHVTYWLHLAIFTYACTQIIRVLAVACLANAVRWRRKMQEARSKTM